MKDIEKICREKEQELLGKYFGGLAFQAAVLRPETIGEYSRDLPMKIEAEYYEFLRGLWSELPESDGCALEKILDKRHLSIAMTEDDREMVHHAYKDATRRTLWERLTKTNHKDVAFYKAMLEEYTRELLLCLRCDFIEDVCGRQHGA